MTEILDHGALTDYLLAHLRDAFGVGPTVPLAGDGEAPKGGGWAGGQPGSGAFRPYTVVVSGGASPRFLDLEHHVPGAWAVGFSIRTYAGSRKQCDTQAHRARVALEELDQVRFGGSQQWKIISVDWVALGPVVRVDATNPATWQVFDTINLVAGS